MPFGSVAGDSVIAGQTGGAAMRHVAVTALESSVTAPVRANARPIRLVLVVTVMLANARIFPPNDVLVPRVAELPTCQKTLHSDPLLMTETADPLAVVNVLPILKMNTALGFPCASSVTVPVNWAAAAKQ